MSATDPRLAMIMASSDDDKKVPLPSLRSNDNPYTKFPEYKDHLHSRACGM